MTTPYDDQTARPGPPAGYAVDATAGSTGYPPQQAYTPPAQVPDQSQNRATSEPPPPSRPAAHPAAGFDERGRVRRGRVSTTWITLIVAAVGLILLIVFIAQNSRVVPIHFLGFAGHLAIGLTVLIAAVIGLLLAAIPGTIRIVQLRKALKSNVPKDQRVN